MALSIQTSMVFVVSNVTRSSTMPHRPLRFALLALLSLSVSFVFGEEGGEVQIMVQPEAEKAAPAADSADQKKTKHFRSKAYDSRAIRELYQQAKQTNEERAKALPDHINAEEMDLIELAPMRVEANDLEFQQKLVEKLNPRPRKRLARIAAFDPEEANIMAAQTRGDREFMAGTYDRGKADNAGSAATFDQNQLMKGLDKALEAVRKAVGSKKSSDEETDGDSQR